MRIFFSVGEPSGDLHGANLIDDLRRLNPDIQCVGFGGPRMAAAGCRLEFELTSLAVMGLWQVVCSLPQFLRLLVRADRYFAQNTVDAVVLIDFPGFNWWIARKAKKYGIPVFYYGVPQVWAWANWRVKKLKRLVDHILCKLPFEVPWFEKRGCQATYVGHPYFDELERRQLDQVFMRDFADESSQLLVLLPGSRRQEVQRTVDWLMDAAALVKRQVPTVAVAVACLEQEHAKLVQQRCADRNLPFDVMVGRTPELIAMADACVACSGSVSLELLFHAKPSVIVYRINPIHWFLQRFLLKIRFITLVNLLACDHIERRRSRIYNPDQAGAEQVPMPEYLRVTNPARSVARWLIRWLSHGDQRKQREHLLQELRQSIVQFGASRRAATYILENLGSSTKIHQESHAQQRTAA